MIDFDQFVDALLNNIGNTQNKQGVQRIFELFSDEDTSTITIHSLRGVARELGEQMSADEI